MVSLFENPTDELLKTELQEVDQGEAFDARKKNREKKITSWALAP